jgi:uncharacterized membrane protein YczE
VKNKAIRILCFVLGIITNSFGIACITKGALGTSPISSVPYVFSLQFAPSFGLFTFIVNALFVLTEIILLRQDFRPVDFLQLAVNVVFSVFIDLSMAALAWLQPQTLPLQVLTVALGSTIMAFGICLEVTPAILLVPGEGVVNAISRTFKLEFGNVKIGFDLTLLLLALVLSLVFWGRIRGLGLGTIISALLVGKLVKVFHQRIRWFTKLEALKSA